MCRSSQGVDAAPLLPPSKASAHAEPPCAKLSIVVPTRDRPRMLEALLEEIAASVRALEVIVVDDHSLPTNAAHNKRVCDGFGGIMYVLQPAHFGAPAARNRGLCESSGDYVWFVDDDDIVPRVTVVAVERLLSGLAANTTILLPMNHFRDGILIDTRRPASVEQSFSRYRDKGHMVSTSCAVFPRAVLTRVGGWDESLLGGQDTDLFLRVSQFCAFVCPEDCAPVRVEISHHNRLTYRVLRQQWAKVQFLRKNWALLSPRRRTYYVLSGCLWLPLLKYFWNIVVVGLLRTHSMYVDRIRSTRRSKT